jgi:hypothetical protein
MDKGVRVMSNRLLASCVTTVALCAGSVSGAHASEEGFYFRITGGQSKMDLDRNDLDAVFFDVADQVATLSGLVVTDFASDLDKTDEAWGLHMGYQWNAYVGAEIGYVNLGEAFYDSAAVLSVAGDPAPVALLGQPSKYTNNGFTAAMLGILPLGEKFDLHARGGILFARNRITLRATDASTGEIIASQEIRSNSRDFFVGLGGAWNINRNYSARLEYQRFLDVGDDEESLEFDVDLISLSVEFR